MNDSNDNVNFSLTHKTAIITGASKGIGLSIAKAFVENGANVVISSRNEKELKSIVATCGKDSLQYIKCHVGSGEDREALVDYTLNTFGKIDILVNNVAINPNFGPISTCNPELFDKIMDINVKAPFLLSNLVYKHMVEAGGGSIIHISSVEGKKPSEGLGIYSISKAALIMLTKSQAIEWGKDNIRVNTILPGLIKTKFSAAIWQNETFLNKFTSRIPLQRMAMPGELNGLAVFLASDASSYCTGAEFIADGGYLIV